MRERRFAVSLIPWLAVLAWTGLVFFLMLSPGEDSAAEDTSVFFGGSDLTDALGHVVFFVGQAVLLYWALAQHVSRLFAFSSTVLTVLTLGTMLKLAQMLVPDRGSSLLDLSANWLSVLIFAGCVWAQRRFQFRSRQH